MNLIEISGRPSARLRQETYHALIGFRTDCRRHNVDSRSINPVKREIDTIIQLFLFMYILPTVRSLNRIDYLLSSLNTGRVPTIPPEISCAILDSSYHARSSSQS